MISTSSGPDWLGETLICNLNQSRLILWQGRGLVLVKLLTSSLTSRKWLDVRLTPYYINYATRSLLSDNNTGFVNDLMSNKTMIDLRWCHYETIWAWLVQLAERYNYSDNAVSRGQLALFAKFIRHNFLVINAAESGSRLAGGFYIKDKTEI